MINSVLPVAQKQEEFNYTFFFPKRAAIYDV